MLQRIRDGLGRHKWLQYTLLGALALVFAAWRSEEHTSELQSPA